MTFLKYLFLTAFAFLLNVPGNSSIALAHGIEEGTRGGGNTINNLPLEVYRKKMTSMPVYQNEVQFVVEKVAKKSPDFANELEAVAADKPWYFVPVHLETLPPEVTGASFPTDQVAMQTKYGVWVDESKYEAIPIDARVYIVVHEMVMGVLWNSRDFLTPHDHDAVRAITWTLVNELMNYTPTEFTQTLEKYGFEKYRAEVNTNLHPKYSLTEFYNFLSSSKIPQKIQGAHYHNSKKNPGICETKLRMSSSNRLLMLTASYRLKKQKRINATVLKFEEAPEVYSHGFDGAIYQLVEEAGPYQVGDFRRIAFFQVNGSKKITDFQIGWRKCAELDPNGFCRWERDKSVFGKKYPTATHVCGENYYWEN